jgi:hypothetical protein
MRRNVVHTAVHRHNEWTMPRIDNSFRLRAHAAMICFRVVLGPP